MIEPKKEGSKRILLVEDDKNLGFIVKDFLELSGYEVVLKENGLEGLDAFRQQEFDLCIFDILLPIKDGFVLAAEIRQQDPVVPIMFFTSKSLTQDKIKAFKIGCDDYITKPFGIDDFLKRIQVLLPEVPAESREPGPEQFRIGSYFFDYNNHMLALKEQQAILSKKECELLRLLCTHQNQLVKREEALTRIWGENTYANGRSMDVFITKLRKRLHNDPSLSITNMHGVGFILQTNSESI